MPETAHNNERHREKYMKERKRFLKKILATLAAFVMVFGIVSGMAVSVKAAGSASITINNSVNGEIYTYYKILDASIGTGVTTDTTTGQITAGNVSYTVDSQNKATALGNLQVSDTDTRKLFTVAQSGDKWNVSLSLNDISGEVIASRLSTLTTGTSSVYSGTSVKSTGTSLTIPDLDPGYYLIKSSLGTNLVAQTIGNVTINEKNNKPTTTKTVEKNNYSIGDYVPYTITVTLPASSDYTKQVIVHDTMDNSLTVNSSKYNATTNPYGWTATVKNKDAGGVGTDFSDHVTINGNLSNNHNSSSHAIGTNQVGYDFILDISSLAPSAGSASVEKVITINYKAQLKTEAPYDTEITNKEYVQYSNYVTQTEEAKIKTFDIDLKKTFTGSSNQETLQAKFELKKDGATEPIKFTTEAVGQGENYTAKYVKAQNPTSGSTEDLVITVKGGENGIKIRGLDAGRYTLTETATASGYNKLVNPITFEIDDSGNIKNVKNGNETLSATDNVINIVNNAGSVLPSTGGIGTTIFYIVGGVIIVGAIILLVARRKKRA